MHEVIQNHPKHLDQREDCMLLELSPLNQKWQFQWTLLIMVWCIQCTMQKTALLHSVWKHMQCASQSHLSILSKISILVQYSENVLRQTIRDLQNQFTCIRWDYLSNFIAITSHMYKICMGYNILNTVTIHRHEHASWGWRSGFTCMATRCQIVSWPTCHTTWLRRLCIKRWQKRCSVQD